MTPDFEGAKQYAFNRLKNELPPYLLYHNLDHTQDDVLPAVTKLATLTGVNSKNLLLLQTAAIYHDLGFVEQVSEHEARSVSIATKALSGFGYNQSQIQAIIDVIMATQLPQTPKDLLGQLLADADLDMLGREDFLEKNHLLRLELEARGIYKTDQEWYSEQLNFLENHTYFTQAARTLRTEQKLKNIKHLETLLYKC